MPMILVYGTEFLPELTEVKAAATAFTLASTLVTARIIRL